MDSLAGVHGHLLFTLLDALRPLKPEYRRWRLGPAFALFIHAGYQHWLRTEPLSLALLKNYLTMFYVTK